MSKPPATIAGPFSVGTTVLLVPSSAPASATYMLGVTATLLDGNSAPIATGTMSFDAGTHACNRATLALTAASMAVDGGAMPDTGAVDLASSPVDLSMADLTCVPNGYDEDNDGISDPCDVCAANADNPPMDTDHDGVPDACDPAINTPGNQVLLFEPFNDPLVGWTGGATTEMNGSLVVPQMGCDGQYAERTVGIGTTFQLQTYVDPTALGGGPDDNAMGLYALDATGNQSLGCALQQDNISGNTLVLLQGTALTDPNYGDLDATTTTQGLVPNAYVLGATRRLRLTVHHGVNGNVVTCELATKLGGVLAFVQHAERVTATSFSPALATCYAAATFSSVFAVSDP